MKTFPRVVTIGAALVLLTFAPASRTAAGETYSNVEVKGTVKTGIFAIGGETTGTTISAKGVTFELDLRSDPELQALARRLDGKTVTIRGALDRRQGVERGERWIITVTNLVPEAAQLQRVGSLPGADQNQPGRQNACQLQRTVKVAMDYLLYLPKEYPQKPLWPLLLFLHGAGERGHDLKLVEKHGPPKLIQSGRQFPFIVVSPQCPQGRWWEPFELTALLEEIVQKYKVDADRIYVTGLSMGGFGTWSLAAYTPGRFAAIVPICGGGEPLWAKGIGRVPAWIFHGAKDPVVRVKRSEEMADALKKIGDSVKLTVYSEAGHDAWTESYANPQLYEWLLAQKRPAAQPR